MNFFERVINFFDAEMTRPTFLSWFHVLCLVVVFSVTIIFCIKFKNFKEKTFKRVVFICWIILIVFELYKQIIYTFNFDGQNVSWYYHLHVVPLQLCSSIIYMLPFAIFLKEGKLKDCFVAFIISFSLFGGLAVMFYPGDVFIETIGINIQTMVHHGLQVFMGFMFIVHYRHKLKVKFFLKAIPVFAVYVATAMLANHLFPLITGRAINMMYLSPYINNNLPIVKEIYAAVPYIIYFIIMMIAYILAAFLIYVGMLTIVKNVHTSRKKEAVANQKE